MLVWAWFLSKIPSIHVDPLEEPVVDIAVGGYDLPYQPEGFTGAWIVTINGRVRSQLIVHSHCRLRETDTETNEKLDCIGLCGGLQTTQKRTSAQIPIGFCVNLSVSLSVSVSVSV